MSDTQTVTKTIDRSPRGLATVYFDAWRTGDFNRLRTILADETTFEGPMGTANGADECVRGLQGMAKMMTGLSIVKMLADDSDVITWYDLETASATLPTVNWTHIENGLITAIRATFDPRPVASPS